MHTCAPRTPRFRRTGVAFGNRGQHDRAALTGTPAGRVREAGYVWFLTTYAATPHVQAVAFAILWLAVLSAASLVGGLVFLASGAQVPIASAVRGRTHAPSAAHSPRT